VTIDKTILVRLKEFTIVRLSHYYRAEVVENTPDAIDIILPILASQQALCKIFL
jgi:hypothetical protein